MSELIYQSTHTGAEIDEAVSSVGNIETLITTNKANLVAAINEVKEQNNTLVANNISQTFDVIRDLSILGEQIITTQSKPIKTVFIHAFIQNSDVRECFLLKAGTSVPAGSAKLLDGKIVNVTGLYFRDASGNIIFGEINISTLGQLKINWSMATGTATIGTCRLQILIDYGV